MRAQNVIIEMSKNNIVPFDCVNKCEHKCMQTYPT